MILQIRLIRQGDQIQVRSRLGKELKREDLALYLNILEIWCRQTRQEIAPDHCTQTAPEPYQASIT